MTSSAEAADVESLLAPLSSFPPVTPATRAAYSRTWPQERYPPRALASVKAAVAAAGGGGGAAAAAGGGGAAAGAADAPPEAKDAHETVRQWRKTQREIAGAFEVRRARRYLDRQAVHEVARTEAYAIRSLPFPACEAVDVFVPERVVVRKKAAAAVAPKRMRSYSDASERLAPEMDAAEDEAEAEEDADELVDFEAEDENEGDYGENYGDDDDNGSEGEDGGGGGD